MMQGNGWEAGERVYMGGWGGLGMILIVVLVIFGVVAIMRKSEGLDLIDRCHGPDRKLCEAFSSVPLTQ